jgi:TatA/E family protein of Tat protein translocase
MGKIGPLEIILILLVVVLMFGGRKIPELMKGIGQGLKELRKPRIPVMIPILAQQSETRKIKPYI